MRWSTAAVMPSALAATTIGSPEGSRAMRSASARLMPSARSSMRANSPGLRCSAAFSRRRITSLDAGAGAARRRFGRHVEIGQDQAALVGCWPQRTIRSGPVSRVASPWSHRAWRRRPALPLAAAKPAEDRRRRGRVGRQAGRHRGAGRRIDGVDQPQRELDILGFFVGAVRRLLHIKVGEDAQQRRADIDAVPACQIDQTVEGGYAEDFAMTRNALPGLRDASH